MFNIRIGDVKFEIYLLLDANEVIIKLHDVMRLLSQRTTFKTFIVDVEKFVTSADVLSDESATVNTFTLTILMSPRHLRTNEIAMLFKEAYKRRKTNWGDVFG